MVKIVFLKRKKREGIVKPRISVRLTEQQAEKIKKMIPRYKRFSDLIRDIINAGLGI